MDTKIEIQKKIKEIEDKWFGTSLMNHIRAKYRDSKEERTVYKVAAKIGDMIIKDLESLRKCIDESYKK